MRFMNCTAAREVEMLVMVDSVLDSLDFLKRKELFVIRVSIFLRDIIVVYYFQKENVTIGVYMLPLPLPSYNL